MKAVATVAIALAIVKAGDRIRFEAEKIVGGFAVTKIEPVK